MIKVISALFLAITKSLEEPVVDENSPPGFRLLPVTVQQVPVKEAWTESPKVR